MNRSDRILAGIVSGPPGRFVAFAADLCAALARGAGAWLRRSG